jgi:NADH-quinone oxidoreductase subunit M
LIKKLTLIFSFIIFILTLLLWILFNNNIGSYSYVINIPWLSLYNINYSLGIDGISIFFIILTSFLIPLCVLVSWYSINYRLKEFMIMLLLT